MAQLSVCNSPIVQGHQQAVAGTLPACKSAAVRVLACMHTKCCMETQLQWCCSWAAVESWAHDSTQDGAILLGSTLFSPGQRAAGPQQRGILASRQQVRPPFSGAARALRSGKTADAWSIANLLHQPRLADWDSPVLLTQTSTSDVASQNAHCDGQKLITAMCACDCLPAAGCQLLYLGAKPSPEPGQLQVWLQA